MKQGNFLFHLHTEIILIVFSKWLDRQVIYGKYTFHGQGGECRLFAPVCNGWEIIKQFLSKLKQFTTFATGKVEMRDITVSDDFFIVDYWEIMFSFNFPSSESVKQWAVDSSCPQMILLAIFLTQHNVYCVKIQYKLFFWFLSSCPKL